MIDLKIRGENLSIFQLKLLTSVFFVDLKGFKRRQGSSSCPFLSFQALVASLLFSIRIRISKISLYLVQIKACLSSFCALLSTLGPLILTLVFDNRIER